jgi:hypothetical protein
VREAPGDVPWHPVVLTASEDDEAPAITTMNHGSGEGVCVLAELVDYCTANGDSSWQVGLAEGSFVKGTFFFTGSAEAITENNGSENIAVFAAGGEPVFLWDDSSRTFHSEVVDPDTVG